MVHNPTDQWKIGRNRGRGGKDVVQRVARTVGEVRRGLVNGSQRRGKIIHRPGGEVTNFGGGGLVSVFKSSAN